MASTPVDFIGPATGLTITGKLYAQGADTELHSSTAVEKTNNKNRYTITVPEALAGWYEFSAIVGTTIVASGVVYLEDTTTRRYVQDDISQSLALIDNKTVQQSQRYISATTAGRVSGAGSGTEVFKGLDEATNRVTATIDGSGNRTDIAYD